MKTIIIDDEILGRELIKRFLENELDINIIAEAENGFDGAKLINKLKPDLIFLDIQMPRLSGFEMLDIIHETPIVIFTTAFDDYALDAFERNAVDYLLKPFSKERFIVALNKAREKFTNYSNTSFPADRIKEEDITSKKIVIKSGTKIQVIRFDEITHIKATGDYIEIHTAYGKFLKQQVLKSVEEKLDVGFIKVHRSYIVNSAFIEKIELYSKESYHLILKSGDKIPVSKSGYFLLKENLNW